MPFFHHWTITDEELTWVYLSYDIFMVLVMKTYCHAWRAMQFILALPQYSIRGEKRSVTLFDETWRIMTQLCFNFSISHTSHLVYIPPPTESLSFHTVIWYGVVRSNFSPTASTLGRALCILVYSNDFRCQWICNPLIGNLYRKCTWIGPLEVISLTCHNLRFDPWNDAWLKCWRPRNFCDTHIHTFRREYRVEIIHKFNATLVEIARDRFHYLFLENSTVVESMANDPHNK